MASQVEDGSQTSVITTEHVLNTDTPMTDPGTYQLYVDTSAMLSGDILELRVKEKVRAGGTQRTVFLDTLGGVQAEPAWVSPAIILLHGFDFTLTQTEGSPRAYPWSIRMV